MNERKTTMAHALEKAQESDDLPVVEETDAHKARRDDFTNENEVADQIPTEKPLIDPIAEKIVALQEAEKGDSSVGAQKVDFGKKIKSEIFPPAEGVLSGAKQIETYNKIIDGLNLNINGDATSFEDIDITGSLLEDIMRIVNEETTSKKVIEAIKGAIVNKMQEAQGGGDVSSEKAPSEKGAIGKKEKIEKTKGGSLEEMYVQKRIFLMRKYGVIFTAEEFQEIVENASASKKIQDIAQGKELDLKNIERSAVHKILNKEIISYIDENKSPIGAKDEAMHEETVSQFLETQGELLQGIRDQRSIAVLRDKKQYKIDYDENKGFSRNTKKITAARLLEIQESIGEARIGRMREINKKPSTREKLENSKKPKSQKKEVVPTTKKDSESKDEGSQVEVTSSAQEVFGKNADAIIKQIETVSIPNYIKELSVGLDDIGYASLQLREDALKSDIMKGLKMLLRGENPDADHKRAEEIFVEVIDKYFEK